MARGGEEQRSRRAASSKRHIGAVPPHNETETDGYNFSSKVRICEQLSPRNLIRVVGVHAHQAQATNQKRKEMDANVITTVIASAPTVARTATAAAVAKAQEFAHRVVEFAEYEACCKFFQEKQINFDRSNASGWTVLMSVCACERFDLVGLVIDATNNVGSATIPNGTTVLHLAAMAKDPRVIDELTKTEERLLKLQGLVNATNRNGDTPLMMACVAKSVAAAAVFITLLKADVSLANASGTTALMCAARLQDEREAPPMREESDALVELLLAHGARVNDTDTAMQQTAVHFALLSHNEEVVKRLAAVENVDLSVRNKIGMTPLQLAHELPLSSGVIRALENAWGAAQERARLMSESMANELLSSPKDLRSSHAHHKKKSKRAPTKCKSMESETRNSSQMTGPMPKTNATEAPLADTKPPTEVVQLPAADSTNAQAVDVIESPLILERIERNDLPTEPWVDVAATRKSRRKHSATSSELAGTRSIDSNANRRSERKKPGTLKAPDPMPSQPINPTTIHFANTERLAVPSPPARVSQAIPSPPDKASISAPAIVDKEQRQQSQPTRTYEDLTALFHGTFPIAAEMDVPVESFIAGAARANDTALLEGLSISQVEMLQDAHLQAYQYLNERKIELARVLEAQRFEAKLELHRQLLDLPEEDEA